MMTQPMVAALSDRIAFSAVMPDDFDELVALRIAAMRDSLERVGRFDPERARERLRMSFDPEHTRFVSLNGRRIGFYTFRPAGDGFHLDHLYVHPSCQSCGVGSHVIRHLLSQSDARRMPVRLGALRDSPSNRFYQRHGFVQTSEDEWDIHYLRTPPPHEPGLTEGTQTLQELPKVSCCLWFPDVSEPRDAVQLTELEPEAWGGLAGWASGRAAEVPALSRLLSAALPVWVLPANLPTLTAECARVDWDTLTEPALGGFSVLSLVISQAARQSCAGLRFTLEGGALSEAVTAHSPMPTGLQNGLLKDALVMLALPPEEQQRLNAPGCLTCDLYEDFQAAWRAAQNDASLGFTPEQRGALQTLSQALEALAPEDCDCFSPGAVGGPGWQALRQQAAAALPCFGWQHATVRPFTQTSPGVWTRPSETEATPEDRCGE